MENTTNRQFLTFVANSCTATNLVFGMLSLFCSARGSLSAAAWCIIAAVLMDAVDGYLARRWKVASEFGANLDSLADMTTFNIAGAILTFYWFSPQVPPYLMGAAAILYSVTGACRLARFNTAPKIEGEFVGMPTTAVAVIVAATYLTCPYLDPRAGLGAVVLLSLLMVSYFPYPKLSRIMNYPFWFWTAVVFAAREDLLWTTWGSIVLYMLSGPLIGLWRRRQGPPEENWRMHRPA